MGSTAAEQSASNSKAADDAALAPICIQNFQADLNAAANVTELLAESSYRRDTWLEKAG